MRMIFFRGLFLYLDFPELNGKLPMDFGRGVSWTYMKNLSPSPDSVVKFFLLILS
jgi:hypothetical protein